MICRIVTFHEHPSNLSCLQEIPFSILTLSFHCLHHWFAPQSPCLMFDLNELCQNAAFSSSIYPVHPAPKRGWSVGQTGFLAAGRRSSSGRSHQFLLVMLTGRPPAQSGCSCLHTRWGREDSDGPGGGKRWVGKWIRDMAVGPVGPSGSPERSGAGPHLHTPHTALHSPSHQQEDAVAGLWLGAWGTFGSDADLPLRRGWTGWPRPASEDVQFWLQRHLWDKKHELSFCVMAQILQQHRNL